MNEAIATIERENRAFWSRMFRERFDRDVALEVDWDSFVTNSAESGWLLYPLYIQQAGIERLMYAITGLMDQDDKFRTAAIDSIHSILVTSAADINAVKLSFHKGQITYRCFAGDWDGYYSIEQIQRYLNGRIPRKSKIRRWLERWLHGLFADIRQQKATTTEQASPTTLSVAPHPEHVEIESATAAEELSPPPARAKEHKIAPYDESLRAELEALYDDFIHAVTERDVESLLGLVKVSRTDEEVLRNELSSDGFVSFSQWLLMAYPTLEDATFVSLKTAKKNLAGYYMAWVPSYSNEIFNLTQIKFLRDSGQWKMVFRLTEMTSAAVQVPENEDTLAKALDVLETNPLMTLDHPGSFDATEEQVVEPRVPKRLAPLKEELEAALVTLHSSLEQRDKETFLAAVVLSSEDEETLRKKFKKLSKEIVKYTPDLSKAVFVSLKTIGKKKAGYYFVAPYPQNPIFRFVYLRPFVYRNGSWKMVFSLDHDLGVSLNIAKSGGDLVSRAKEVIKEIDLLHLDWVMTSLFDDIIKGDSS